MSETARELRTDPIPATTDVPARVRPTRTAAAHPAPSLPAGTPSGRPSGRPSGSAPRASRRVRRGNPTAFWVLTGLLVTGMVVGIVSLSALLVRSSFRMDALRQEIAQAQETQQELRRDVAALSSPSRVFSWARDEGFEIPDDVVIVSVPGGRG